MPISNFKYVVLSFSFIHLPIGSDYMILILTIVECLQRKDVYCLIFGVCVNLSKANNHWEVTSFSNSNKKVLLHECKRQTTRCMPSTLSGVQSLEGGFLIDTHCKSLNVFSDFPKITHIF